LIAKAVFFSVIFFELFKSRSKSFHYKKRTALAINQKMNLVDNLNGPSCPACPTCPPCVGATVLLGEGEKPNLLLFSPI